MQSTTSVIKSSSKVLNPFIIFIILLPNQIEICHTKNDSLLRKRQVPLYMNADGTKLHEAFSSRLNKNKKGLT